MSVKDTSPRLGRGIAALLGEMAEPAAPGAGSHGVRSLAIALLEPGPFQPRDAIDPSSLNELTDSVRIRGILQPLLARPHPSAAGHFQIIAGERRWRAAQRAGLHEVPVLVRDLPDVEAMGAALVENLQRQDLDPIEEAEGYRRLLRDFGLGQEQLAVAVGKSRSHVANTIRLLKLPPSVQGHVKTGAISAGHGRALLMHQEPEKAALAVIARGLNVRQTEALSARRSAKSGDAAPQSRPNDPETESLERELSSRLGLRVLIAHTDTGGRITVHYTTLEQLEGVIALLNQR
jgi:ParB family transcriptional regulator, chromosome partitioning protein